MTTPIQKPANKYAELRAKLDANRAICESIEPEMKPLIPSDVWVCYYNGDCHNSEVFLSESDAKNRYPSLVKQIVHYTLAN